MITAIIPNIFVAIALLFVFEIILNKKVTNNIIDATRAHTFQADKNKTT